MLGALMIMFMLIMMAKTLSRMMLVVMVTMMCNAPQIAVIPPG